MTYQVMPPLSADEYQELKADIAQRGVLVPVEIDDAGNILDGHHRVQAARELGLPKWPQIVRIGLSEDEKRAHARKLNMARRHLTREQRRELIAASLKDAPEKSDRQHADELGADHKTVGGVRKEMHASGVLGNFPNTTGTDGRQYPRDRVAPQPRTEVQHAVEPPSVSITPTAEDESAAANIGEAAIEGLRIKVPDWVAPQPEQPAPEVAEHNHRAQGTGDNQWFTPDEYLQMARAVLGEIDLDPASHEIAQQRVQAGAFFTEADDGLSKEWNGRVWLNPPYAQPAIQHFIEKTITEYQAGRMSEAIVLTHNYTDTSWFHAAARHCSAICFTRGRIRFRSPDGALASPTQGQAFFYFGKRVPAFAEIFSSAGFLVEVFDVSK